MVNFITSAGLQFLLAALVLGNAGLVFAYPGVQQENPDSDRDQAAGTQSDTANITEIDLTSLSLAWIGNLEMRFNEKELANIRVTEVSVVPAGSTNFSEVVNQFRVRKRGRFYGSLYAFHRNDNLDARNFFDPVGEPLPEFKRNQFGGSFGVMLFDRMHLFGTYDGLRINRGSTRVSHIPTLAMKSGDFSALAIPLRNPFSGEDFPNNQIPESMFHPVAQKILSTIPDPNRSDPDRNFVNNLPEVENQDTITGRIDYEFSEKTTVFGQYRYGSENGVEVADLPVFGTNQEMERQELSVDITRRLGSTILTTFRLSFDRWEYSQLSKNAGQVGLLESLGIAGVATVDELDEGYPEVEIEGYIDLGATGRNRSPRTFIRNEFGLNSSLSYTPGSHNVTIGSEIRLQQINNDRSGGLRRGAFGFSGTYTGDGFADFLLGIPDSATRAVGSDRADLRRYSWSVTIADNWRISRQFTVSASLTYSFFSPYRSVHDNVSVFSPFVFEPPVDGKLVVVGHTEAAAVGLSGLKPGEAVYPDRNDWAPSLGLGYSPFGNNSLVFRGGYRISYDPMDSRDALNNLGRNYPFYYIEEADSPSDSPQLELSNPFEAAVPSELTIRGLDPFFRNAYIQNWQATLQTEFLRNWTLQLGYEGRKVTRASMEIPANVPLPGPGSIQERRPNSEFGRFEVTSSRGSSIGHTLNVEAERRFFSGFSCRAGFSWNRTFSDVFFGDPSNPRELRSERALYGYYPPRRVYLNYIWDLPFGPERTISTDWAGKLGFLLNGWRLSGITNFNGGRPFNPELPGDPNNDGVSGDRPDRINSGVLKGSEQSIDRWFATEAFIEPAPYTFGNSGRNILFAPPEQVWDISLIKTTRLSPNGSMVELRVQFFNAFNHVNFEEPDPTLGTSKFARIFGAREAREIEIAIKYSF
jgi:hypothetical protein